MDFLSAILMQIPSLPANNEREHRILMKRSPRAVVGLRIDVPQRSDAKGQLRGRRGRTLQIRHTQYVTIFHVSANLCHFILFSNTE